MSGDGRQSAIRAERAGAAATAGIRRKPVSDIDPLLRAALDHAASGLIVLDREKHVRLVTRRAAELLGLEIPPRLYSPTIMRLLVMSPFLDQACLQILATAFSTDNNQDGREILLSIPHPAGARVVSMELCRAGAEGWVASLQDVTQSRETQNWLLEHASTDPITGLWNRQHFMLMLRDRLETPETRALTVLVLDLKRFQPVNNMLGTEGGDALLRLVGGRLQAYLREDDLLARFPSDEFGIIVSDTTDRSAIRGMGERLKELLSRPFMIEGQLLTIGAHIGAACAPEDGETPEVLVANAGLALAAARSKSRGEPCFFEPKLDEQARRRRALEAELRHALDAGTLDVHYQPQISLDERRLSGFEALVRWTSPLRGAISPAEFIPIAEDVGMIRALGEFVLRRACRDAMDWPEDISIAVNASPLQVEGGHFAQTVQSVLGETGLPGHRLEIEITENLLLRDDGTVAHTFAELRRLGVRVVLDDFGTGYASLSQLARFQFDKLKIDRSLLATRDVGVNHAPIVRAIAALGASLGVPTTAEGVETAVQLQCVHENGCTSVQGFYYSKAVAAADVPDLLGRFYAPQCEQELGVSAAE